MNIYEHRFLDNEQAFDRNIGGPVIDRTNTILSDRQIIEPIPSMPTTPLDFVELCDTRAIELLQLNKPIKVMYSGGIDSTLVIVALLKALPDFPSADITVILTRSSIIENIDFYNTYISKMKISKYVPSEHESFAAFMSTQGIDFILVTGEIADQLFGSVKSLYSASSAHLPYNTLDADFINLIQPIINIAPYELNTQADLWWWVNFTLKYQWILLRIFISIDMNFSNIHHFFNTTEFQQWSMTTPISIKWPDFEPTKYKLIMKQYIYEFDNDIDYLLYKLKIPSLLHQQTSREVDGFTRFANSIDADFNVDFSTPHHTSSTTSSGDKTLVSFFIDR